MSRAERCPGKRWRIAGLAAGTVGLLALPVALEIRVKKSMSPATDRWQGVPVEPRESTPLGISFRPRQVESLGLDARSTFRTLLAYPFDVVRLGAYWNRMETVPGRFTADELDWQLEAAEKAGKKVIVCLGAIKVFGYPEFFVPAHHLPLPFREGSLVVAADHQPLVDAATTFIDRVVERYRNRNAIVAWQVEHEAVDPLGVDHSWRLAAGLVGREVAAVREADPSRPVMMNGFLPTSSPVRLQQWWRTRDQGDSLAVAQRLADIVGIDYYPRHALLSAGSRTLYLDGARRPWNRGRRRQLFAWAQSSGRSLMISEGQAEPWESVTTPPNPTGGVMSSCKPEQLIENYNQCMRWSREAGFPLDAYLFWGAEYWLLRQQSGDPRYLEAFARILEEA